MKRNLITIAILSIFPAALFYNCNSPVYKQPAESVTEKKISDYLGVGKNITTETQSVLAKNLVGAINKAGTEYALEFCNTKAILLTDSMSLLLNAGIKRVSDKPRNAGNQANEPEIEYIRFIKAGMEKGEIPEATITEMNGKMVGYYPIITNKMCLQCHGNKEVDIKIPVYKKINKLYPGDKAIGYKENEVRGVWVIEMKK